MKQSVAAVLAIVLAANAAAELFASRWWYGAVPGVVQTGPYNGHFIKDIGAAYLVVALGLGWFAARPRQGWPALVAATAFLVAHGLIHIADAISSPVCGHDLIRDFPGVFMPGLIAAWLAGASTPTKGASDAESLSQPVH
jgi:hypothetical protein